MGDIAKGAFSGAWALLVGWILPTAVNLGVFLVAVWPTVRTTRLAAGTVPAGLPSTSLLLLTGAVVLGLVLFALRTPLYRLLEGYLLWPSWLTARRCAHHIHAKHLLKKRRSLILLANRDRDGEPLTEAETDRLAALRADPDLQRHRGADERRGRVQRALLGEQLRRYPVDDRQITPTRLGNAIRRFEEYGHDRFRLDTQVLWDELTAVAPDPVRRQIEAANTHVDFFIALLYGHLLVAATALAALTAAAARVAPLLVTALVALLLTPVWYRCAVAATDGWASSVRALVNTGRKPLADALGLALPTSVEDERRMWTAVTRQSLRPFGDRSDALDAFRSSTDPASPDTSATGPEAAQSP
ncbi:hypothetical protein [Kitasatospora brasiliensis]|uniref:hypothetical protein n=1 Tax=Kitasatospora brasiliensis TaxID=3058040 RepID=UPI00292FB820|nr:hypothetical protein [Kitasatospora sp. K002]